MHAHEEPSAKSNITGVGCDYDSQGCTDPKGTASPVLLEDSEELNEEPKDKIIN